MRDKTLMMVFCWSGDAERLERHWKYYERAASLILPVFPVDAPCGKLGLAIGKSQKFGPELIYRVREALRLASRSGSHRFRFFIFTEADSIFLDDAPETILFEQRREFKEYWHRSEMRCKLYRDSNPKFKGGQFCHFPWHFQADGLEHFAGHLDDLPLDAEQGFADRWMGYLAQKNNLPVRSAPYIHSVNQFDTPALMNEAVERVKAGALWLHGVKTKDQLEELLRRTGKT